MDAQGTMHARALETDEDAQVATGPLGIGCIAVHAVLRHVFEIECEFA